MARKIETNVVKPETKFEYLGKEYLHIDSEQELLLDSKIDLVNQFMKNNSGKGKESQEQDALYGESQKLWQDFIATLESTKYNFYLNKDQWKFLTDLIYSKLEYDVNTVFFAIELNQVLNDIKSSKYTSGEILPFAVTATEVTYIYHLIQNHKVKGLGKDSLLFSQILLTIGAISKIFNYYDATGKNMSNDIQDWVLTFEEGVFAEGTIQAQVPQISE
jgi:hypothetical protein